MNQFSSTAARSSIRFPMNAIAKGADTSSMPTENLLFTVRLVQNDQALSKAVQIRHNAYMRHVPEFAETLALPERTDRERGVIVLLAESKLDGEPLGTMRIQTNEFEPLSLEQSVELPLHLRHASLAEATRLGVTGKSTGRLVKTALFKAFYQYCMLNGIEYMVIAGRSPIDRQYDRLMFEDVYPGLGYIPLRHANNMPHRIMSFHVATAYSRWESVNHPLLNFVCHTHHPDINVSTENLTPQGFVGRSSFSTPVAVNFA